MARVNLHSGALLAFDADPGTDGKIRVGVWDRFATMGFKQKGGSPADFTAENLSTMARNWYARGQRLPMCLDHQSALGGMVRAPAAAFYDALAVVDGGQVVGFWKLGRSLAEQPDPATLAQQVARFSTSDSPLPSPDGLWGFRCEVTPLGEHPTEGLRNYRGISPLFQMDGVNEREEPIGPVLFDVSAINDNFQAGCELAMGAIAMAGGVREGNYVRRPGDGSDFFLVAYIYPNGTARLVGKKTGREYVEPVSSLTPVSDSEVPGLMRAFGVTPDRVAPGNYVRVNSDWFKVINVSPSAGAQVKQNGRSFFIEWSNIDEVSASRPFGATDGAARAFGGAMNPELMKKMGLAEGASMADKMAAYQRYAYDATPDELEAMAADMDGDGDEKVKAMARKFRAMKMDVDPNNLEQNAAIHLKTGNVHDKEGEKHGAFGAAEVEAMGALISKIPDAKGKPLKEVLAMAALAIPTAGADDARIAALVDARIKAQRDADEKAAQKREADALVAMARQAKADESDIVALGILAGSNLDAAKRFAEKIGVLSSESAPHLFGRLTRAGGPAGAMRASASAVQSVVEKDGVVRFGMDLSAAARDLRAKNPKLSVEDSIAQASREQPHLLENYYGPRQ